MFWLLRAVVLVSLVMVATGCAALPSSVTDKMDKLIKDNGAGQYQATFTVTKDGKQLGKVSSELDCTADAIQLTGCHPKSVSFEGPK